jgi:1-phosphatidylinositol phosphodiesterase
VVLVPSVQCQGASVTEQLAHGVRFFDFRLARPFFNGCGAANDDDLQVIHGNFPVRIPLPVKIHDVLDDTFAFLQSHPSECVIVSLKAEGPDKWEEDEFADLIWRNYISPRSGCWYLNSRVPTMGECRGKAILFRRFGCKDQERASTYGIDAQWWKYNTTDDDRGLFTVQDWCEVMSPQDIDKKKEYVSLQIERACSYNATTESDSNGKLYINFCSGSNFWNPKCWPKNVANGINNTIPLTNKGCGIIIIDYAELNDWSIVRKIVELNRFE